MTSRDHTEQEAISASGGPEDSGSEPHCHATTRRGQPCRNRPVEGTLYCRIHTPLADTSAAATGEALPDAANGTGEVSIGSTTSQDVAHVEAAPAAQELEEVPIAG